jgi:uncharacterized repeat protein (TIGR01451 family)
MALLTTLAPGAAAEISEQEQCESVPGDDWCEDWVATFDGGSDDLTWPFSALSPDGSQLAMTGYDHRAYPSVDIVTAAFDTASGENLWAARYPSGNPSVSWGGIAVSADKVFVVGTQGADGSSREMVTLAYNAAPPQEPGDPELGEQLWAKTSASHDGGQAIAVTPDGATVVVVGNTDSSETQPPDIVTIAYDAATGEQRWLTTHGEPGEYDLALAVALSPDGQFAYVTGFGGAGGVSGAMTIAYAVDGESAGEETWAAVYDAGAQGHQITVSSNGARVFIAAQVGTLSPPISTITTLAYDATSGEQLWAAEYAGGEGQNLPVWRGHGHEGIAVSPDDDLVFVTGEAAAEGCSGACHIPVLAYDQATGDLAWSQTYVGADDTNALGKSVASSPDGALVYVGGVSWKRTSSELFKRVTLAYDSRTGGRVAVARYPGVHYFPGHTVLPDPDGRRVYVAGPLGREPNYWALASHQMPRTTDLSVATVVPSEATVGEPLSYSFTVANAGPDEALGVRLKTPLPEGVELVSADSSPGRCSAGAAGVTCHLEVLAAGQTTTVSVAVKPTGTGTLITTATVGASTADPDRDNNYVAEATMVGGDGPPLPASGPLAAAIINPASGADLASGETLHVAGAVRFEAPAPSETKFYLGGNGCDGSPLTTRPSGFGLGCLQHVESVTPVNELSPDRVHSEFTTQAGDGVPLIVNGSEPLSGVVAISSLFRENRSGSGLGVGAGLTTVDVTVTGVKQGATEAETLATATSSYTATPEKATYTVPWSADVPEEFDRKVFASVTLSVVVRGYNAGHGAIKPRDTTLTVPIYTESFDRRVEVSLDDGPFTSEGVAVADDLTTWATTSPTPTQGTHTIRARAVQGLRTSSAATRTITVTGAPDPTPTPTPTPTESGSASPSPSESPPPAIADVSFTDNTAESGQHSDRTLFEARLTDSNGDSIEAQELTFELTGSESTRSFASTTDADGVGSVTPTLEEKPGPYQLTVRFAGDDDHAGDADTTAFVVEKEDSATELSVKGQGNSKTLEARLSDLDTATNAIAGRTVEFYSDGELIGSRTTNDNGVASVPVPPAHRGNNRTYEVVFAGDDYYVESSDERAGKGNGGGGNGNRGGRNNGSSEATHVGQSYEGRVLLM